MIKGVNKQILEVTNPESPYFERIIFFVRPQSQAVSEEKLQNEAKRISATKTKPPRTRRTRRQMLGSVVYSLLGVGAGVGVMMIINYIM